MRKPDSDFLLAKRVQHSRATDGKTENGSQRGNQQEVGAEMKDVGEEGGDGEDESEHIEPKWSANPTTQLSFFVSAQAQLQQKGG